ncbi:Protease precursor [Fulvivirga imtechensis AK7]|uniref:Protease n=1 Tax=Fulvivirga imtechensis AK7 TaxID=1237149 RepID=L8JZI8_9BACT|nr:S8 family peptidase [Fulvivirga imtechensis]ELR73079.1 Protease precursor [Fulvivirga imtechensis AK7]
MKNSVRGLFAAILLVLTVLNNAQAQGEKQDSTDFPPKEWSLMDPGDNVQGISVEKAYSILKNKRSETVVVAVIDSGVDIDHEDLQGKIWINEGEIEGNGIDDDKNGYVDDRYGWNFIGGKTGNVEQDTYELTRIYVNLKEKYGDMDASKVKKKNKAEYEYWLKVKADFEETHDKANQQYVFYSTLQKNIVRFNNLLKAYLDVEKLSMDDLRAIDSEDSTILAARNIIGIIFQNVGEDADFEAISEELEGAVEHFGNQVNYAFNTEFDPRSVIGDNYANPYERGYGNNDVKGHDPSHGTHVAGIIAANRDNELGIQGIADNVKIMVVRAVPDGDERDKDVANAIIYAVDNGARIINMSFGKSYSPQKEAVDKAVKYAESKGVLLIHAAGNSSKNTDNSDNFPNKIYGDTKTTASNWLEIGASSWGTNEQFVGSFSNYGKNTVDVFAPGVNIYSTTPDNTYQSFNGTSMAAPATAGVAALLMSYYPELTAFQVRDIIVKSSRKFDALQVLKPGKEELVDFKDLSISGGLINAYEAVKMAESMTIKKEN